MASPSPTKFLLGLYIHTKTALFLLGFCPHLAIAEQLQLTHPSTSKTLPRLSCEKLSLYQETSPSPTEITPSVRFDQLLVSKSQRKLFAFSQGAIAQSYAVAIGQNSIGPKMVEGDLRTPEGEYFINFKTPSKLFHLALQISYPNAQDRARAKKIGVSAGHSIMLHGFPAAPDYRAFAELKHQTSLDWTEGCIAVRDPEIEEIYARVETRTSILICP